MPTNAEILDFSLEYAISEYILPGENKADMLAKFNNDKVALVVFMRERALAPIRGTGITKNPQKKESPKKEPPKKESPKKVVSPKKETPISPNKPQPIPVPAKMIPAKPNNKTKGKKDNKKPPISNQTSLF